MKNRIETLLGMAALGAFLIFMGFSAAAWIRNGVPGEMSNVEFAAEVIKAIAWPVVVLVVAKQLLPSVSALLKRVKVDLPGGATATFYAEAEMERAEEALDLNKATKENAASDPAHVTVPAPVSVPAAIDDTNSEQNEISERVDIQSRPQATVTDSIGPIPKPRRLSSEDFHRYELFNRSLASMNQEALQRYTRRCWRTLLIGARDLLDAHGMLLRRQMPTDSVILELSRSNLINSLEADSLARARNAYRAIQNDFQKNIPVEPSVVRDFRRIAYRLCMLLEQYRLEAVAQRAKPAQPPVGDRN